RKRRHRSGPRSAGQCGGDRPHAPTRHRDRWRRSGGAWGLVLVVPLRPAPAAEARLVLFLLLVLLPISPAAARGTLVGVQPPPRSARESGADVRQEHNEQKDEGMNDEERLPEDGPDPSAGLVTRRESLLKPSRLGRLLNRDLAPPFLLGR